MNASASLSASADLAETRGRPELADFWRKMARDASGLGGELYRHWAVQAAEYIMKEQAR